MSLASFCQSNKTEDVNNLTIIPYITCFKSSEPSNQAITLLAPIM